jgi:hypothetical protein
VAAGRFDEIAGVSSGRFEEIAGLGSSGAGAEMKRGAPPRRLGLLETARTRRGRRSRDEYPYPVGYRIAGDLTVTGHLAAGRSGHLYQVWSARDWCAYTCKIVAPERAGSRSDIGALRREARILRAVGHPNIVRCYGVGEHDGLPYMLLEYLDGPSLFDVLESQPQRRLEISDAVRAAIHLGAALYHLHRRGFLHLDLKPANLLLRDGGQLIPQRRRVDSTPTEPPRPARVHGAGGAAGAAPGDVYGLGALLYELLTGTDGRSRTCEPGRPRHPQADAEASPPSRSCRSRSSTRSCSPSVGEFGSMHPCRCSSTWTARGVWTRRVDRAGVWVRRRTWRRNRRGGSRWARRRMCTVWARCCTSC